MTMWRVLQMMTGMVNKMKRFIIRREGLFFSTISPTGRPVWVDLAHDTGSVAIFLDRDEAQLSSDYVEPYYPELISIFEIDFPG